MAELPPLKILTGYFQASISKALRPPRGKPGIKGHSLQLGTVPVQSWTAARVSSLYTYPAQETNVSVL